MYKRAFSSGVVQRRVRHDLYRMGFYPTGSGQAAAHREYGELLSAVEVLVGLLSPSDLMAVYAVCSRLVDESPRRRVNRVS